MDTSALTERQAILLQYARGLVLFNFFVPQAYWTNKTAGMSIVLNQFLNYSVITKDRWSRKTPTSVTHGWGTSSQGFCYDLSITFSVAAK